MEEIIRTLSASVAKNIDIVSVTARSAYPEDAAQIVNAVVRAYIRWHEANRQLGTADLLKDLNGQLEKRSRELQLKRKERMMFEQRHPDVVENTRDGITPKTLDLLKQELAGARVGTLERDSYYQGLQRFAGEPDAFRQYVYGHQATATAAENNEQMRLRDELDKTQFQLAELQANGVAQHSRITLLRNRKSELEKGIAALGAAFVQQHVALAKSLSEDAYARERQLTEMYEKEFAKVQNLGGQDSEYAFIISEGEMIESLCDSLLKQINTLDLNERLEGLRIHVLEKAEPAI